MGMFDRKSPPLPLWCDVEDVEENLEHMETVLEVIKNLDRQYRSSHATDIADAEQCTWYSHSQIAGALSWLIKKNLIKLTPKGFKPISAEP